MKLSVLGVNRSLAAGLTGLMLLAGCTAVPNASAPRPYVPVPVPIGPSVPIVQPIPQPEAPVRPVNAPRDLVLTIDRLAREFRGRIGIAVVSTDDNWITEANGLILMPQQSVSKLWVSMTLLDMIDQGRATLNDPITVRPEDLTLFHQPIAALVKGDGYRTTVGGLLSRAMTMSDNTANDRLLNFVGGPDAVRGFIARRGLGPIRFGPGERLLQAGTAGLTWHPEYSKPYAFQRARAQLSNDVRRKAFDGYIASPPDGASASAIARALVRLKRGELLKPSSTATLIALMTESKTGKSRLRGAVPAGWSFGHKTGTGQDFDGRTAGYNDVGILTAPDGRSYGLAVLIGDSRLSIPQKQATMQAVVEAIVANHNR